jgi:hypothetical protein
MTRRARGLASVAAFLVAAAGAACGERVLLGNDPPPPPPPPPCQGKVCGEPCVPPPCTDEPGVMCPVEPVMGMGVCDADGDAGACVPPAPGLCIPKDPCAGLLCNAPCKALCVEGPPGMPPNCMPGRCDMHGVCIPGDMMPCPPPDPCAGHKCGYPCSPCDPMMNDAGCPPPAFCDMMGLCRPGPPMMCGP